jgi:hypothetical protein
LSEPIESVGPDAGEQPQRDLYAAHAKQAWEDIQSSTDSFDKNLLTLSSGALGLSLAFIKDIVPFNHAVWPRTLYASWISFALCIVLTVFSFRLSIAAQNKHLEYLAKYYLERQQEYFNKMSVYSRVLSTFTWLASGFFLVGLVCTLLFCLKNVGGIPK